MKIGRVQQARMSEGSEFQVVLLQFVCRVSNCYLSVYLHIAGDYDNILENTFGVLEKSWNLFLAI